MNPRTRKGRFVRRRTRRIRSKHRVYRNPKHLSAAHKRAVSLGVKRAMARRKGGSVRRISSKVSRRVRRSRVGRAVARRTRTITRSVVKYRNRFMRRSSRRRSSRRRSGGFGSLRIRSILSKDNVTRAAGIVGASVITNWVMRNWGARLPGITASKWVGVAYAVAIPVAGAYLVKKVSPKLAEGILLGGIASGIIQLLSAANVGIPGIPIAGVSAYLGQNRRVRGTSGFLTGTPAGSRVGTPSPQALNTFGASPGGSIYDSAPAFRSAWTR